MGAGTGTGTEMGMESETRQIQRVETKAEREDGDGNRAGIIISLALKTLPIVSVGSRRGGGAEGGRRGRVGASHSDLG